MSATRGRSGQSKSYEPPRFEQIVTEVGESFLWRCDDYPWERNVWNFHPEVEIHLITNSSGVAFVGDYIGEFGPGYLTVVGGGLPHDWVTSVKPGQRIPKRDVILQFDADRLFKLRSQIPELSELDGFLSRIRKGVAFTGRTAIEGAALLEEIGTLKGFPRLIAFLQLLQMMAVAQDYVLLSSREFLPSYDIDSLTLLQHALQHISEHYTNELSLNEVAGLLEMTESQFSRFFKKHTGNTFTDHLAALRLHQACLMLSEDDYPITDICFRVGYSNISNFNRRFKARYRMTPSAYRKLSEGRRQLEVARQAEMTSPAPGPTRPGTPAGLDG